MYLEAVTVCVDYSDILALTIPYNKSVIDNWVIVTSTADKKTQGLCDYHKVKCITTDVFYESEDIFNKGKGINIGFDALNLKGWILHLDADILLPPNTKQLLEYDDLDEGSIYSVDRIDIIGRDSYIDTIQNLDKQYSDYVFVEEKRPISTRMFHNKMGYCPIGYFQLFHNSKLIPYSERHSTAARSDVLFLNNWTKKDRRLFPGVFVYHLMSEISPMGTNWDGRKSSYF